jgi:hypothetical protein
MTLLKNDGTVSPKQAEINIIAWPTERMSGGIGLSIKDGWYLGIGFGLAMTIAVPLILLLLICIIGVAIMILGNSIGALF